MIWGEEGNKHSVLGWRCRQERHIGKQEPEGQHTGTEEARGVFWIWCTGWKIDKHRHEGEGQIDLYRLSTIFILNIVTHADCAKKQGERQISWVILVEKTGRQIPWEQVKTFFPDGTGVFFHWRGKKADGRRHVLNEKTRIHILFQQCYWGTLHWTVAVCHPGCWRKHRTHLSSLNSSWEEDPHFLFFFFLQTPTAQVLC